MFVRSAPFFAAAFFSSTRRQEPRACVTPASRRAAVPAQSAGGVVLLRDGTASSRRGGEEREDGGLGRGLHIVIATRARSGGITVIVDVVLVGASGEQRLLEALRVFVRSAPFSCRGIFALCLSSDSCQTLSLRLSHKTF